jgi:hypothetical protein
MRRRNQPSAPEPIWSRLPRTRNGQHAMYAAGAGCASYGSTKNWGLRFHVQCKCGTAFVGEEGRVITAFKQHVADEEMPVVDVDVVEVKR